MELLEETKCFEEACDKLAKSKLALVDKKIAELLSVIASSERIYSMLAECMINFNYDVELKRAIRRAGTFVLPKEDYKSIAFVFSLINNFDKKKINLFNFIDTYYQAEFQNDRFVMFCNSILNVWKELVIAKLIGAPNKTTTNTCANIQLDKSIVSRLNYLIKDLSLYLNTKQNKKINNASANIILDALLEAIELNNIIIIRALIIALEEIAKADKGLVDKIKVIKEVSKSVIGE